MEDNEIRMVESTESPEFSEFKWAISHSSIIGLNAEWKRVRIAYQTTNFPPVLLLQIACQLIINSSDDEEQRQKSNIVFLLNLSQIHLPSIYDLLKDLFISPHILKLGFHFKRALVYLSFTFRNHGCHSGFDTVVPYLDIANLNQTRRKHKCKKSLSSICHDLLGFSLSERLKRSDWSVRPLTHQQETYAALAALCLIQIFNVFLHRHLNQGSFRNLAELDNSSSNLGLKHILSENDISTRIMRSTYPESVEMVRATIIEYPQKLHAKLQTSFQKASSNYMPMDYTLLQVVREYGYKIELTELDGKPRKSKEKGKERRVDYIDPWQGPTPWDPLLGGDGCPKFLCDHKVAGLVKLLRCVGVDAAYSKEKPEPRELIDKAIKEKRVILTGKGWPLGQEYLLKNQIYRVKSIQNFDQLKEVIETFQLNIRKDQLMSRCTICNGRFIQKTLSSEEAIKATKGFQVIPYYVFDQYKNNIWQCTDCNHIYWQGVHHVTALRRYMDVCADHEKRETDVSG